MMKREEFMISLEHTGKATPSRHEVLPEVSKLTKTDKDLIIIDKIFSMHGKSESKIKVFVYESKSDIPKEKLEKMQRRMKKKKGATAAEGEATKEEVKVKEEKPKEAEKSEEKEKAEKPKKAKEEEKSAEKPEKKSKAEKQENEGS